MSGTLTYGAQGPVRQVSCGVIVSSSPFTINIASPVYLTACCFAFSFHLLFSSENPFYAVLRGLPPTK
ncbi:hypothetical protein Y032_0016g2889 [Ancylostoma ceylanicum]|uniref:Uncharacterized protein n=1 Tax=Ancylostoma ceylanicum TaxID=53326 RepID=A0A016V5X5_9BILA|nr:hypothetical protein Y032_0016g2889 [Ancylostoma ceylanicum]